MKRRIEISKLLGISMSFSSSEFVIHVHEERDYRYRTEDSREKIISYIIYGYYFCT